MDIYMDKIKKKAQLFLDRAEKFNALPEYLDYKKAMCFVCLDQFQKGAMLFQSSFEDYYKNPRLWATPNQPDVFVNVCILSGHFDLTTIIHKDLMKYIDQRGDLYFPDYYSLIVESFSEGCQNEDINTWISKLLEKYSVKEGYELGRIAQALRDRDQKGLDSSLLSLLNIHDRSAKHGGLRDTPDGLFSLNAMTLAFFAKRSGLSINRGSFFLPIEYLDFLLENKK
jgi:hypothetical protein